VKRIISVDHDSAELAKQIEAREYIWVQMTFCVFCIEQNAFKVLLPINSFYTQTTCLKAKQSMEEKLLHYYYALLAGLSVEGVIFLALFGYSLHRYLTHRRSWVLLFLIVSITGFWITCVFEIIISPVVYVVEQNIIRNMTAYIVPHLTHLFYLAVITERLKHFSYFLPHWKRIRFAWWAVCLLSEMILYPLLYLSFDSYPELSFYALIINSLHNILSIVCNFHIDLLLLKCITKQKTKTGGSGTEGTLKKLWLCLYISLTLCVNGIAFYTFWVLFAESAWFPVWLQYVCTLISYPARGIHFACQIRFQMLISAMIANESKHVVIMQPTTRDNPQSCSVNSEIRTQREGSTAPMM
jgi:hypothetical protein